MREDNIVQPDKLTAALYRICPTETEHFNHHNATSLSAKRFRKLVLGTIDEGPLRGCDVPRVTMRQVCCCVRVFSQAADLLDFGSACIALA